MMPVDTKTIRDFIMNERDLPWLNTDQKITKKKPPAKRKSKSLTTRGMARPPNEILLKAAEFVDDEFWKDIITKTAHHRPPVKFSLNGNILSFRKNMTITQNLQFDQEDVETLGEKVIAFIQDHTTFRSRRDIENEKLIAQNLKENKQLITSWKQINSYPAQLSLMMNYSSQLIKQYFPDLEGIEFRRSVDNLFSLINTALTFKFIDKDDIIMNNQRIENIPNIKFDEELKVFYVSTAENNKYRKELNCKVYENTINISEKIDTNKNVQFSKLWQRTCKTIDSRGIRRIKRERDLTNETLSVIESSQTD